MENHSWKAFPFPIMECLFLQNDSPGVCSTAGGIAFIHRPTQDVWLLSTQGSGCLSLDRYLRHLTASADQRERIAIAMRHLGVEPAF